MTFTPLYDKMQVQSEIAPSGLTDFTILNRGFGMEWFYESFTLYDLLKDRIFIKRRLDGKEIIISINGVDHPMTMSEWSFLVGNPHPYPAPVTEVR